MYFIILLILFYQTALALIYNDVCTNNCDFPEMVCVNNRCICDPKNRLFWTNARCAPCPKNWTMTETACIIYYETEMSWERAKLTCRNLKAELISFRSRDLISLVYSVTDKKQFPASINKLRVWTSAHSAGLSGLSVYRWLDKDVNSFDDKSDWWCKNNTPHLGYTYKYNEPTRYTDNNNETEACVVYWRSTNNTQVVCLDDQLCSREFAFICEKSESTANQYLGPPPAVIFNTTNDLRVDIVHTVPRDVGTIIVKTANRIPQSDQAPIGIIIISIIGLLFLLALLGGILFFLQRRNTTGTGFNVNRSKGARRPSKKSGTSENDTAIKDEPVDPNSNASESDLVLETGGVPENVEQKNRRGGYSKQQFDEFE